MIVAMTDDGVSLTIKITLDDVTPQVWRLVEVPSDMLLPELHDVIQDVMGWENRHLHMFFAGEQSFGDGQRYEMRFSLDEDDDGTGLAEWLRSRGVDAVDVVGIATDHCVKATAADAVAAGFATRVLLDLTAGVSPTTTAQAVETLRSAGVDIAS